MNAQCNDSEFMLWRQKAIETNDKVNNNMSKNMMIYHLKDQIGEAQHFDFWSFNLYQPFLLTNISTYT